MKLKECDFRRVMNLRGAGPEVWDSVTVLGEGWLEVDIYHPAYPRKYVTQSPPQAQEDKASSVGIGQASQPTAGPGTELKKLLKTIGITANPGCSCNARAAQMDVWGSDECERRIPEIVVWLGEEAQKRKLPFLPFAGEQIVKLAIRRARKAAAA
jgi:hypothetical protein